MIFVSVLGTVVPQHRLSTISNIVFTVTDVQRCRSIITHSQKSEENSGREENSGMRSSYSVKRRCCTEAAHIYYVVGDHSGYNYRAALGVAYLQGACRLVPCRVGYDGLAFSSGISNEVRATDTVLHSAPHGLAM